MIESLIAILIVGLILALLWFIASKLPFMAGVPMQIFGVVLALIWVLYTLNRLGVLNGPSVRL